MQVPRDILIIGYGNPLRGDDGAGPWLVDQLAAASAGRFDTLVVHQLTPDLAEVVSHRRHVVFVDAAVDCPQVSLKPVLPAQDAGEWGHQCGPGEILALASVLYQARPNAWLVRIPAVDFSIGAAFSSTTHLALPQAERAILDWVQDKTGSR